MERWKAVPYLLNPTMLKVLLGLVVEDAEEVSQKVAVGKRRGQGDAAFCELANI